MDDHEILTFLVILEKCNINKTMYLTLQAKKINTVYLSLFKMGK